MRPEHDVEDLQIIEDVQFEEGSANISNNFVKADTSRMSEKSRVLDTEPKEAFAADFDQSSVGGISLASDAASVLGNVED